MTRSTTVLILFCAAALEAGGDAIVRLALHSSAIWARVLLFVLGAAVLFAYGCTVNSPPWEFGRLLGVYVVFFFVIAQIISWLFFHQAPSKAVIAGGLMIVGGGVVMSVFR